MTQEEKDLLLKYLCAALPYDVIVDCENYIYILNEIDPACKDIGYITVRIQDVERLMCAKNVMIEYIKPYLRPMDSMTNSEKLEFQHIQRYNVFYSRNWLHYTEVEWLLKNHFDFMGLIPKGLAIEVTKENNPYEKIL